jgi:hypothetical protein
MIRFTKRVILLNQGVNFNMVAGNLGGTAMSINILDLDSWTPEIKSGYQLESNLYPLASTNWRGHDNKRTVLFH